MSDHPHAGGENPMRAWPGSPCPGPSPRGWGERGASDMLDLGHRTIPTRVGRTPTSLMVRYPNQDHPHAGGEN